MICIIIVCITLLTVLYYRRKNFQLFKRCNIPGPKPSFIFGNFPEANSMPNVHYDTYLTENFGGVVGYYLGTKPIILVTDPTMVELIQIQHKNWFLDRPRRVPGGINPSLKRRKMLGNLPVNEWRSLRQKISPAFSPSKVKGMEPLIFECVDEFMSKVEESRTLLKETDFYELFQLLAIDIIGKTAFGVCGNIQRNPNSPFMAAIQAEFRKSVNTVLVQIYLCFPEIRCILSPLRLAGEYLKEWFGFSETSLLWNMSLHFVKERRQRMQSVEERRNDLMQSLLDAELDDGVIQANTALFFEAAFETLSSTLAFVVHFVVNNEEIQDKVRTELATVVGSSDRNQLKSAHLDKLKYLEAVINETLRISPPQTTFIGRSSDRDVLFTIGTEEITIPKGTHVQIGLWQIHHNEDLWPNADAFDPSRFEDGSVNTKVGSCLKWQAFGCGPRHCVGYKYAYVVLKMVLAHLFMEYRLKPSMSTESRMTLRFKQATCTPANGSFAGVEKCT